MFNKVERGTVSWHQVLELALKMGLPGTKIRSLPGSTVLRKHSFSFSPSIFDITTTLMGDLDMVSPDFLPSSFLPSTHLSIHFAIPPFPFLDRHCRENENDFIPDLSTGIRELFFKNWSSWDFHLYISCIYHLGFCRVSLILFWLSYCTFKSVNTVSCA